MALTERDKRMYDFLIMSKLPFSIMELAMMFYNDSGNIKSAYTISSRRINIMKKGGYLQKMAGKEFGSESLVYTIKPPSKQLRHQRCLSKFICQLMTNGFQVLNVQTEKEFKDYGIRCDALITIKYNKMIYDIVTEVNLTTPYNQTYDVLVKDILERKLKFQHQVIFVNISDFTLDLNQFEYVKPITIKSDMSTFNRFQWLFIK